LHARGGALLATCAGSILIARRVLGPEQVGAGLLDAEITRNAYGRQAESFEALLEAPCFGAALPGVFIRAPRFTALGPGLEILARHQDDPVLVRQGRMLAATFHPELTQDDRVHRSFLLLASNAQLHAMQQTSC
jgi:5'-phosphate synthase pdxT subunit